MRLSSSRFVLQFFILVLFYCSCGNTSEKDRLESISNSLQYSESNLSLLLDNYSYNNLLVKMNVNNSIMTDTVDGPVFERRYYELENYYKKSLQEVVKEIEKNSTNNLNIKKTEYLETLLSYLIEEKHKITIKNLADTLGFFENPLSDEKYLEIEKNKLKLDYRILFYKTINLMYEYVSVGSYRLDPPQVVVVSTKSNESESIYGEKFAFCLGYDLFSAKFKNGYIDTIWKNGEVEAALKFNFYHSDAGNLVLSIDAKESGNYLIKGRIISSSVFNDSIIWPFEKNFNIR